MTNANPALPADLEGGQSLPAAPSFRDAFKTFAKIGLLSFGGPTAQIALMHRVIVEERKWLSEQSFLNALSFCMFLPGPEAMQLATYAGWRLHGMRGGLAAGLLFVLPGAVLVLALSMGYAAFGNVPIVQAVFDGIQAAVLVIVIEALLRISKRALKKPMQWFVALVSFVAIFFFSLPFPIMIGIAALFGVFFLRDVSATQNAVETAAGAPGNKVTAGQTLATTAAWLIIWIAPLALVAIIVGNGHVLTQIAIFFSKLAVVTFGGAYAVLAYMAQEVVQSFGWLEAAEMLDGLGLAETTNGPLILVTEFVAYLAAYRSAGEWPVLLGIAGAGVALWATFAPCFLWVFAGAPYIERLQRAPRLRAALAGITAAVVGVILNLTIWFALHVFFAKVDLVEIGLLKLWLPDAATLDWRVVGLSIIAGVALLRLHLGLAWTLLLAGGLALAWFLIF
ncbi:MAG: chromate efflux transporter [Proteobacteria bacterium]|nr:chromate efflux transporter [Pseudomonadota bacterium]